MQEKCKNKNVKCKIVVPLKAAFLNFDFPKETL